MRTKDRPLGSIDRKRTDEHERSTHRDFSGFEHVEREFAAIQEAQIANQNARAFQQRQRVLVRE